MPSVIRPSSLWERIAYPFRRGPDRQGRPMGFFTDTSVCIGCKACQVACKQWNLLPGEEPELSGHSYDNTMRLTARTWRHVAFVELPPSPAALMDDGSPDSPNLWRTPGPAAGTDADSAAVSTAELSAGSSGGPDMDLLTGRIAGSTTGATGGPTRGATAGGPDMESATGPLRRSTGSQAQPGKKPGSQAGGEPGAGPNTGSAAGPLMGPESSGSHAGAGEEPGTPRSQPGQAPPGSQQGSGTRPEPEFKPGSGPEWASGPGVASKRDAAGRMRWLFSSDSCKHCADPPCLRACPTGALAHTEYSGVYLQTDICNGCAACVAACPFGVADLDEASGQAHKCTFCLDRVRDGLVPACAKTCPTRSIQYGPLDELRRTARARLKALRAQGVVRARLYGLDPTATYPALHNIFLLQDEPALYGLPAEPVHPALRLYGDYLRAALGLAFALGLILYSLSLGGAL